MAMEKEVIDILTSKAPEAAKQCAEFAKYVERNIDSVLKNLARLDVKLSKNVSGVELAKDSINAAIKAAYEFVNCIDDFFHYGKSSDFVSIKNCIKIGDNSKLQNFICKMDECLKNATVTYTTFTDKCNEASKKCTEIAESCATFKATARNKKNKTRVVGGVSTAVMLSGGIASSVVAGVFTFGIGAIVGLSLTAFGLGASGVGTAVITAITAYNFGKAEDSFKSMALTFRELAQYGIDLRSHFEDMHTRLMHYQKNHFMLNHTNRSDKERLCKVLDRLQSILTAKREKTAAAREVLRKLKIKIAKQYRS